MSTIRVNSGTAGVIWQRVSAQLHDSCARRLRPIECAWQTHLKAVIHHSHQSTSFQEARRMQVDVVASAANTAFVPGLASFRKSSSALSGKPRKRGCRAPWSRLRYQNDWLHVAVSDGSTDGHSDS